MKTKAEMLLTARSLKEYNQIDSQIPDDGSTVRVGYPFEEKLTERDFPEDFWQENGNYQVITTTKEGNSITVLQCRSRQICPASLRFQGYL